MRLVAATVLAASLAGPALCQMANPTQWRLHVGYQWSSRFHNNSGRSVSTEGPVLGIEMPIISAFKFDFSGGITYFGGGRLTSGGDSDADVWRFMALGRVPIPESSIFLKGGLGYSFGFGRGDVGDEDGVVYQIGVQIPLSQGLSRRFLPNLDVYYVGGKSQLSGIAVGLTASF